ncbi:hypothetical protein Tco_0188798 [Tanacetum coccineum]
MTNEREITPPSGFSTPPQIPNNTTSEIPPVITIVFATTTPENMPFAYCASTSASPNPMISTAFVKENYEDEEREVEPRPEPNREATPTLRPRYPVVHRQRERVVEFKEAPNKERSRRGRNAKVLLAVRRLKQEEENTGSESSPHTWRPHGKERKQVPTPMIL